MSQSVLGKQWRIRDESPQMPRTVGELMVRLLRLRGINSNAEASAFLQPALAGPVELPNLAPALDRMARAIADGERIAVYGDYDADGMTATAVLVEGLTGLGADAIPYIPDRFGEGYGLNDGALRGLIDRGVSLVITVDTGTSAIHEVAYANERSLDVVILDHHTPKDELPDAVAVVNPHLPGTPPSHQHLSGCGVAFVVLGALAERLGRGFEPERYLDLVAIGTVCDVVPLVGVNRSLVTAGLARLTRRQRPGLAALLENARHGEKSVTAHTVGFMIGPRLNAAGRLDHGLKAYDLLTTRDECRARELAWELEELNRRRQQLTFEAVEICRGLARAECDGAPLVMVGHPEIGSGIVGLVASRLAEEHYRPAIVFRRGPEYSVGSARSIDGFDIHAALAHGSDLMVRFGGHTQAGGFTVRTDRVEQLRTLLTEWTAAQQDWCEVAPSLAIDLEIPVSGAYSPHDLLGNLKRLEPCGQANSTPVFVSRNVRVRDAQITQDGRHLRLRLDGGDGTRAWPAIAFGMAEHRPRLGARLDVAYEITEDRYREPQLRVVDFMAPARTSDRHSGLVSAAVQ